MGQMGFFSFQASMRRRKNRNQTASMCRLDTDTTGKEVDRAGDALSSRCMLGRGVKRKRSESEEAGPVPGWVGESSVEAERQLILDLCLSKLQCCYSLAEPSLRRTVLLSNTLRHIQDQMRREGVDPPATPAATPLRAPPTPRHAPQLPASEPEGLAFSFSSSAADSLFGAFEISNSTSYLTDLPLDDIFEDIDTSMYDSSEFFALPAPEDSLKPLPSSTAGSLQLCLTDPSELDHIMEVLVRS